MHEWIGWTATAVFGASYLFRDPRRLRVIQGVGALLWLAYGVLLGARPVIAANLLVAGIAFGSLLLPSRAAASTDSVPE